MASITSLPVMAEEEPRRTAICTCLPDTMADILSGNIAYGLDLLIVRKVLLAATQCYLFSRNQLP